jgi:hypothetical protein
MEERIGAKLEDMIFLTSINPNSTRHQVAIPSWLHYGRVQSFNQADEIKSLRIDHPNVEFVKNESPRCRVQTILDSVDAKKLYCLINDDIVISNDLFEMAIDKAISGKVVAAKKWHTDHTQKTILDQWGIDAFLFYGEFAKSIKLSDSFLLGKPWWDYAFPYAMLKAGYEVIGFERKCLLHEKHPIRWNQKEWIDLCFEFLKWNGNKIPNTENHQEVAELTNQVVHDEIYRKRAKI